MFNMAANARQHTQFPGRELNLSHEDVFLAVSCRRSRDPITRKWSWRASPYHNEWIAMIKCICPQPFNPGAPDYKETQIRTMYERSNDWSRTRSRKMEAKQKKQLHTSTVISTTQSAEEVAESSLLRTASIARPPPLATSRRVMEDSDGQPIDPNNRAVSPYIHITL
jgi:hypothetical protein